MFGLRLKHAPRLMFIIPGVFNKSTNKPANEEELKPGDIAIDRVMNIFKIQPNGRYSMELEFISSSVMWSLISGGFIGGVLAMLGATRKYKEESLISQYATQARASRDLQTKVIGQFFKGFYSIGWRTGLFVGLLHTTATILYTYDGKMKVEHYTIAGGLTGACYQFPKGFKPAFSGVVFGSLFGTIGGLAIKGVLHLSGYTLSDLYDVARMNQEKYDQIRREKEKENNSSEVEQLYEKLARHKE